MQKCAIKGHKTMSSAQALLNPNVVDIPRNRNIIAVKGNKLFLQAKKRVSKFKTSLKVRKRISAGLRRFKLPLFTIASNAIPIVQGGSFALEMLTKGPRMDRAINMVSGFMSPYTGVVLTPSTSGAVSARFDASRLWGGLIPNLITWGLGRIGIFRSTNRKLSQRKIPISLS